MADATTEVAPAAASKRVRRPKVTDGALIKDQVALGDIVLDTDVQPRETIHTGTIKEYADAMEAGVVFPDIIVYRDADGKIIAADGWHRISAAKQIGKATINAEIRTGTKRDAILYSVSANATHGLRRTNDDKRRAVARLLEDDEWGQWSDNVVAEKVGVSQPFVSGLRKQLSGGTEDDTTSRVVRTSDGREMDIANIGKNRRKKADPVEVEPAAATNGHAPIALVPDAEDDDDQPSASGFQAEDDGERPLTVGQFAQQFADLMMEIGAFEPQDVFEAMDSGTRDALADKWDEIISKFDGYSDALETVLEAAPA